MIENIMEHIARQTGKDPLEVRMRNMKSGNEMEKLLPNFAKSVGKLKKIVIIISLPITFLTSRLLQEKEGN